MDQKKTKRMELAEKPHGIIITFPVQFLYDLGTSLPVEEDDIPFMEKSDYILNGFKECIKQLDYIAQNPADNWWWHSIGNKPTHEVLWCYITILGKIRYKAKVGCWEPGGEKQFADGRKRWAKHWLMLCDFTKAPKDIERKGFQGFRYTEELF